MYDWLYLLLGSLLIATYTSCFFISKSAWQKKLRIIHIIGLVSCVIVICILAKKMFYAYILVQLLKYFGLDMFSQVVIDASNTALIVCMFGAVVSFVFITWAAKVKVEFDV